MSTSRFVLVNACIGATTENGGGGSAPALDETTGYPMTNALLEGRKVLWQTAATPASPLYFDVDLGTEQTMAAAWIAGLRYSDNTKPLGSVVVSCATTYYPGGGWTAAGTITVPAVTASGDIPRDAGVVFAATHAARYWRFAFTFSGAAGKFSLGKLGLGVLTDLGVVAAPGSTDYPIRFRTVAQAVDGIPEIYDYGDPGRALHLSFPTADTTLAAQLLTLQQAHGTLTFIDYNGNFYEVWIPSGGWTAAYGRGTIEAIEVELARLP